jgi:hypothetical protein
MMVDWGELEMLRNDLAAAVRRGAFHGIAPQPVGERMMDAHRLARIAVADVDHVHEWERMNPLKPPDARRRQELGDAMLRLLALVSP